MSLRPTTFEEVQAAVQSQPRLLARGGGSKPALSTPPTDVPSLELSGLSEVLEYEPGEFTFTALAGTPASQVIGLLAEHGQYLPFDPLLVRRGATLGGLVAASTSGPGRYRYGGVRDFLIGVRFVDGQGRLVRGGGKVVKNSAGFDLPKLMVGSLGRLGVLVELSFKVFPQPEAYATLQIAYSGLQKALAAIRRLRTCALDLNALDLEPPGVLRARIGGLAEALPARLQRLEAFLADQEDGRRSIETIQGEAEAAFWQELQEFDWAPSGWGIVKIPLTASRIPGLEKALESHQVQRRYSVGGNVAWVAWPVEESNRPALKTLDTILTRLSLTGLLLLGPPGQHRLGVWPGEALARRVKQALDPTNRFLEL